MPKVFAAHRPPRGIGSYLVIRELGMAVRLIFRKHRCCLRPYPDLAIDVAADAIWVENRVRVI